MPKESHVTLVPHITFIRPNTLLVKAVMTLFWVNTKRKTVMTLIRIVLLSNGCAVITLFKIYLKRVMTDPFTFECHYSFLDHVKLKLYKWLFRHNTQPKCATLFPHQRVLGEVIVLFWSPTTPSLLPKLQGHKNTDRCVMLGAEVPGHDEKQLT